MKLLSKGIMAAAFTCALMLATSCSNDDYIKDIPADYTAALKAMFPDVKNAVWENNSGYKVAEFYYDGFDTEAWFDSKAQWAMTQTEYNTNFLMLPQLVQDAFLNASFSIYAIDDIEGYVRPDTTFYVIEVEEAGVYDQDVYITADGTITQIIPYEGMDVTPTTPLY